MTKGTVLAIPYAGGDKYAYRALESLKPRGVDLVVLELPGRGTRSAEARLRDIAAMTRDLLAQTEALELSGPYVLVGHSMGAILAYELMRAMLDEGHPMPQKAYLSSIAAPSVARSRFISHLPSAEFWEIITKYNGMPQGILDNPGLRSYFEAVLRDDFAAIEKYRPSYGQVEALPVNIQVSHGDKEELALEHIMAWQQTSLEPIEIKAFSGSHFFIFECSEKYASMVYSDF